MTAPRAALPTSVVLLATIAENAAALLRNPTLGIDGVEKIASLLHFAVNGFTNGSEALSELTEVHHAIQTMVSEQRVPTDEEWAAWQERFNSIDARFTRVEEELAGEGSGAEGGMPTGTTDVGSQE